MIIKYTIGKRKFEEEYSPRKNIEHPDREECYFFDAALQLEMDKVYLAHGELFETVDNEEMNGFKGYQFLRNKKEQKEENSELGRKRARIENMIQLYVVTQEYISSMKDSLERLYESHSEAKKWYDSLGVEDKKSFDTFRTQLLVFVEKVALLLAMPNSLNTPLEDWNTEMPIYTDIPYVDTEKLNKIVSDIQEIVRGADVRLGRYDRGTINSFRKHSIRNRLRKIPDIFNEKVSVEPQRLREAKSVVFGRNISEVENIGMMISLEAFEQKNDKIEDAYCNKINESAEFPCSFEDMLDDETYVELIRNLEEKVHGLILLNKGKNSFFTKNRCVALFDLKEGTRLFSLSGLGDYNGTSIGDHNNYEPADKVYNILCEDSTHDYIWCRLTPAVKRYFHKDSDNNIQALSAGTSFDYLKDLVTDEMIPRDIGGDFSCCERKIFAYFEEELSKCDRTPRLITRWAPCELCIPAINELYRKGIDIRCFYIWKSFDEYKGFLEGCINKDRKEFKSEEKRSKAILIGDI